MAWEQACLFRSLQSQAPTPPPQPHPRPGQAAVGLVRVSWVFDLKRPPSLLVVPPTPRPKPESDSTLGVDGGVTRTQGLSWNPVLVAWGP